MERWETIKDHPNYEVSNLGKVKNTVTGRILKPHNNNGYDRVRIEGRLYYVHRLVADAFRNQGQYDDHRSEGRIVRCKDCAVPHNRWTGCPKLNGLVTPPDFYCSYGEKRKGR